MNETNAVERILSIAFANRISLQKILEGVGSSSFSAIADQIQPIFEALSEAHSAEAIEEAERRWKVGMVVAICVSPVRGEPMQMVEEVEAIAGAGLRGDRYCTGQGSFSKGIVGKRPVTLINGLFVPGSGFTFLETRRNIMVWGEYLELNWLSEGREFPIGDAIFKGVKYCDPCTRPGELSGNPRSFKRAYSDRGGIVAEVIKGGMIRVFSPVIPPPKGY
ncbi:MAG: hypothetical protein AAB880_01100 [Patescibacteria group bacterium]